MFYTNVDAIYERLLTEAMTAGFITSWVCYPATLRRNKNVVRAIWFSGQILRPLAAGCFLPKGFQSIFGLD